MRQRRCTAQCDDEVVQCNDEAARCDDDSQEDGTAKLRYGNQRNPKIYPNVNETHCFLAFLSKLGDSTLNSRLHRVRPSLFGSVPSPLKNGFGTELTREASADP